MLPISPGRAVCGYQPTPDDRSSGVMPGMIGQLASDRSGKLSTPMTSSADSVLAVTWQDAAKSASLRSAWLRADWVVPTSIHTVYPTTPSTATSSTAQAAVSPRPPPRCTRVAPVPAMVQRPEQARIQAHCSSDSRTRLAWCR